MFINLIYITIAAILIFVLYLAVKAITRGVEAKGEIKETKEDQLLNSNITNDILKLKELLDSGAITEEEIKKAKDKILKNLAILIFFSMNLGISSLSTKSSFFPLG